MIVELIGAATTSAGLQVRAELDSRLYQAGIKVTNVDRVACRSSRRYSSPGARWHSRGSPYEQRQEDRATPEDKGAERRVALVALRGWFEEWSTAAKSVVKKKSHLIRLGFASRKSPEPKAQEPD